MSLIPKWSSWIFVIIPISQRLKPKPERKIPPLAVSRTANSTVGSLKIYSALIGPVVSPFSIMWFWI